MAGKILLILCVIPLLISGQVYKSPSDVPCTWENDLLFPEIDFTCPVEPKEEEKAEKSYREIAVFSRQNETVQAISLCRRFLNEYPQSRRRGVVSQILRGLVHKNLLLYPLESPFVLPNAKSALLMAGQNLEEVEVCVYKIDPLEAFSRGFFYCAQKNSIEHRWTEKISHKGRFKREITLPLLPPGCYAVIAREKDIEDIAFLAVTDLGMLVKRDGGKVLAWVASRTRKPLPGKVSLHIFYGHTPLYRGNFSDDGLWAARIDGEIPLTFVAISQGHIAVAESSWYRYRQALQHCYFQLDRTVYRPGETVHAKIFLRTWNPETSSYVCDASSEVVTVQDENWQKLAERRVKSSSFGTVDFHHSLATDATPGEYTMRIRGRYFGETRFSVENTPKAFSREENARVFLPERADRARFHIGESVSIILPTVYPALLTCERDLLYGYCLRFSKEPAWQMQVKASMSPGCRITASYFTPDAVKTTTGEIAVDNPENTLCVDVEAKIVKNRLDLLVSVKDHEKKPSAAELLVWVMPETFFLESTDRPSIWDFYYPSTTKTVLPICDSFQFEFPNCRENQCAYQKLAKNQPRERFLPKKKVGAYGPCLYWNSHLNCNAQGEARVEIPLSKEQQWRVSVIAIDKNTRIGQAHAVLQSKN